MKKVIRISGIIACIIFIIAGYKLNNNGKDMKELRSQGGTSLAEAYYQDIGVMNEALGYLCYGLGVGIFTIAFGISANIKEKEISEESSERIKQDIEKLESEIANKKIKKQKSEEPIIHQYADKNIDHEYVNKGTKNE